MTKDEVMQLIQQNENAGRKKSLLKAGAHEPVFGVLLGYLRKLAEQIGTNHELAVELWNTGCTDARLLAVMLFDPKKFDVDTLDHMLDDEDFDQLIDDFIYRCVVFSPHTEVLEKHWYHSNVDHKMRAAWGLIVKKIGNKKYATKEFLDHIVDVVEKNLVDAPKLTQWNMNRALAEVGFRYPDYTERCLNIAERLGVYKDWVPAPGCTSPYAVDWINVMLKKGRK